MALFVTSTAVARRHGVYAIEQTPPAAIRATGTGTAVLIDQFPWGPAQKLTYFSSPADMINTIAPPGMSRLGQGYLATLRKQFGKLGVVRVLGTAAATATATIASITPTNLLTITLKYPGSAGNSVTWAVTAADDGNANHVNIAVSVTGASGTTTDIIHNLNVSGTGADQLPAADQLANMLLVGSVTKLASGIPAIGTGSFSTGADGTIDAAAYSGTPGAGDRGIAQCEGDKTVDFVFTGDPGNSLRAGVNAALEAHADLMTDRIAVINGNSGQAASAAQADVASYRSKRCVYVDPWVYIYDDTTGAKTLVTPAPFLASVATQLPPSTSVAWKAAEVQAMLHGIVDVEFDRGDAAANNTDAGIVTVIREPAGGFTFESAKNTFHPTDPTVGSIKRTRMAHYIARSIVTSLRPYTDSPNVPTNQQDEIDAVDNFMGDLKRNLKNDPNHNVHVVDYSLADVGSVNTTNSIQAGIFIIPLQVQISADQEKIFLSLQVGETVTVTPQL